jgi:hypothetical protein
MRKRLALLFVVMFVASLGGEGPYVPDDDGWGADRCLLWMCPSD